MFYLGKLPGELIKPCAFRCYRHYPITEFMIKNGADVNAPVRGSVPYTPFHLAIKHEEGKNWNYFTRIVIFSLGKYKTK